jgi:hypothetical protein
MPSEQIMHLVQPRKWIDVTFAKIEIMRNNYIRKRERQRGSGDFMSFKTMSMS